MSSITSGTPSTRTSTRTIMAGVGTAAAGIALAVYSAYGDPHAASKSQTSAVPFLIVAVCVVAALIFGLLLPRITRVGASAEEES